MFPKVVIEHRSTALGAFWNAFTVFAMSLPAAVVWFTISMLKGDAYSVGILIVIFLFIFLIVNPIKQSCAYWPETNVICPETNQTYPEPCQAPKTVDTKIESCEAKMARDLKAESHIIGWSLILGRYCLIL